MPSRRIRTTRRIGIDVKPAPFEYSRPADVDEACALLAADEGARVIAGGQTLVPLMAMRLARPTRLIDIARIPELAYVRDEGSAIEIGATTKQHVIENDPLVGAELPLLASVMPYIGHGATRARGTIGGSIANGDHAAEIVLVAITLGATLRVRDDSTTSELTADQFFLGPMRTALSPAGVLIAVRFPVWPEQRIGVGFHEINARQSDFAFVSAAAQIAIDAAGRCTRAAIGIGAATAVPLRLEQVAKALEGKTFEEQAVRQSLAAALADFETLADLHASADYRRRAAVTLAARAIADAYRNAHVR
jgi:CO/xanthine dehydrogenase FAD-binding subunit